MLTKSAKEIYSAALKAKDNDDVLAVMALDDALEQRTGQSALELAGINLTTRKRSPAKDDFKLGFSYKNKKVEMDKWRVEQVEELMWAHDYEEFTDDNEEDYAVFYQR